MTNRERLMQMSDEDFADLLCRAELDCYRCPAHYTCRADGDEYTSLIAWLRKEVDIKDELGIAGSAPEIEKIKSESADYFNMLNSWGKIDYWAYSDAFDFYMDLIDKAYEQGKKDAVS